MERRGFFGRLSKAAMAVLGWFIEGRQLEPYIPVKPLQKTHEIELRPGILDHSSKVSTTGVNFATSITYSAGYGSGAVYVDIFNWTTPLNWTGSYQEWAAFCRKYRDKSESEKRKLIIRYNRLAGPVRRLPE